MTHRFWPVGLACVLALAGCKPNAKTEIPEGTENQAAEDSANAGSESAEASEEEKVREALIDKPAVPFVADHWINGDPTSLADLKGKVVLLDFWAVWCGPCIATFEHLREWNEKYASQGLEIIGLTTYYHSLDWSDEKGQIIEASTELSPEQEQQMLVKFAEHYQLKYRLAVLTEDEDKEASKAYGIEGIPQLVLIDRSGNVRMIRIGSGQENADDIENLMVELLEAKDSSQTGG